MKTLCLLLFAILYYGCNEQLTENNHEALSGNYRFAIENIPGYDKCLFQRTPLEGDITIVANNKKIKGFINLEKITYPISGEFTDTTLFISFCERRNKTYNYMVYGIIKNYDLIIGYIDVYWFDKQDSLFTSLDWQAYR